MRETGATSSGYHVPPRVGNVHTNTYSVCMINPTSSASPGDGIDDEEESPRLSLPSFSLTPGSSVPVAHKDKTPAAKESNHHSLE